jgi:hypothetical protein
VVTYADDTCLLFSGKSWKNVKEKTTIGLNRVYQELNNKKLTLNIKKTNFIAFSIHNTLIPVNNILIHTCGNINSNTCNCQEIIRVTRIKYLGVIIDSNLRWNIHIENTVMRLRSVIFKFYKLNKILPMEVMRTVYEALYKSIMQYGLIIWGGCADNAIRPLIVQQNLAVRICLDKKERQGSSSLNYKTLKVLPVRVLYKLFAIVNVSKQPINKCESKREFRAYDVSAKYTNKQFSQRFVDYLGPVMYNSLPLNIKKNFFDHSTLNCNNVEYIKRTVKTWLLSEFV